VSELRSLTEPGPEWADWWEATRERRFLLQRCIDCGNHQHYPRSLCIRCGSADLTWDEAAGSGVVYSHTTVHRSPLPVPPTPYVVALVRLSEGPVLLTNIVGCEPADVRCDLPVVLAWEAVEDGRNLPLFRPA
jgi:uncharacterized OB-fold protein